MKPFAGLNSASAIEAAARYREVGLYPVPVPYRQKKPVLRGWPGLRLKPDQLAEFFGCGPQNIGVILGDETGLCDVDCDCAEAVTTARTLLPETGMIFGRASNPASHYFYRSDPPFISAKYLDPTDKKTLVELRCLKKDGGTGLQTIVPPSTHKDTGEKIQFELFGDGYPANIDASKIQCAVAHVAVAALLARHWPEKGSRHNAMLALAGGLARAGWPIDLVKRFCRAVYVAVPTHDPTAIKRSDSEVQDTFKKISDAEGRGEDAKVTGWPKLSGILGESVVGAAVDWLSMSATETVPIIVPRAVALGEHSLAPRDTSGGAPKFQATKDEIGTGRIDVAREIAAGLDEKLRADSGAVFEPDVLDALELLQRQDPPAWARVREVLRKRKIALKDLDREVRKLRATLRTQDDGKREGRGPLVSATLPDSPVPDLVIPAPYHIDETGTYEWRPGQTQNGEAYSPILIAHAPIVISERHHDVETGNEALRVHWRRADGWRGKVVDRGVACNSQKLIDLASEGFPVDSTTAKSVAKYVSAVEAANWGTLRTVQTTSHLGWQGRDLEHGFLCGRTQILPSGEVANEGDEGSIQFRGATPGDEQIADAFRTEGSLDAWRAAIGRIREYPRALFGLYAAFVPPLLPILGCPNFIVDWARRTSVGKTTVLRVAASVWGCPNEHEKDSVLLSWDSTRVYIERAASILSGLPLLLDETKRVKDPRDVAAVLYEVAQGRGRGRGNIKSTAVTRAWRTVMLSTGEAPATSFTQDGGTRARTLEITGWPLGEPTDESAHMVADLNRAVCANYGHAGVAFVQWVVRYRSEWDRLREEYRMAVANYRAAAPVKAEPSVVDRIAQYLGAVHIASKYAHMALGLDWGYEEALREVWVEVVQMAADAAGEERALAYVVSWAHSHEQSFLGREFRGPWAEGHSAMPPGGWSGRWDRGDWQYIGFFQTVIRKILTDLGYNPDAILSAWKDRGWLKTGRDRKRLTVQVRMGDGKPHLVAITREAIERIESAGAEDHVGGDSGDVVETQVETV